MDVVGVGIEIVGYGCTEARTCAKRQVLKISRAPKKVEELCEQAQPSQNNVLVSPVVRPDSNELAYVPLKNCVELLPSRKISTSSVTPLRVGTINA